MKLVQVILIVVALVAAGGAALVMMNISDQPAEIVQQVVKAEPAPVSHVLVAAEDVPMGAEITPERLQWQEWPKSGVREAFITQEADPEAFQKYAKAVARTSFFAGEPIRNEKIVHSDSGYLSAILPAGKRAVAVRVEAETSAGGFILPNDHVDVIMSFRNEKEEWITETILENVKVLAIDQVIEEQDGEKAKVGNTATLELTPEQAQIISVSSRISGERLMLALRSIEDSGSGETAGASHLLSGETRKKRGSVRLIRFGKSNEVRPKQ